MLCRVRSRVRACALLLSLAAAPSSLGAQNGPAVEHACSQLLRKYTTLSADKKSFSA
jgi:hypothetical protein